MLKFFQVITYHPKVYNEFENDIIVTSEYQVMLIQFNKFKCFWNTPSRCTYNNNFNLQQLYTKQCKTQLSAHDGL